VFVFAAVQSLVGTKQPKSHSKPFHTTQPKKTKATPGGLVEAAAFDTADGLYDVAWSEEHEGVLAAACGDGSVKLYDLGAPPAANPLRSLHEHRREVRVAFCVRGRGGGLVDCVWIAASGRKRADGSSS
jgi:hypothetical protein